MLLPLPLIVLQIKCLHIRTQLLRLYSMQLMPTLRTQMLLCAELLVLASLKLVVVLLHIPQDILLLILVLVKLKALKTLILVMLRLYV